MLKNFTHWGAGSFDSCVGRIDAAEQRFLSVTFVSLTGGALLSMNPKLVLLGSRDECQRQSRT